MRKYIIVGFLLINFILFYNRATYAEPTWDKLESKDFTVYHQKKSLGSATLEIATKEYERITEFFRFKSSENIKIYVYNDRKRFQKVAPSKSAVGFARPFPAEIAVLASDSMFPVVISHELTHVIMLRSLPNLGVLPFWFVEGVAIYLSEPQLAEVDLERYALRGDLHNVEELRGQLTPEEQGKAAAEGYLLTKLLVQKFGEERLRDVVFLMQKGANFDRALEEATGLTNEDLQKEWHEYGVKKKRESPLLELRFIGFLILGALSLLASAVWLFRVVRRLTVPEEDEEEYDD